MKTGNLFHLFLCLSVIFMIPGCAGFRSHAPASLSVENIPGRFRAGQILDLEEGKVITFDELIARLDSTDLVFLGEVHDNAEHHLIQVQILQALIEARGRVDVAMEFFQTAQQDLLDRYMVGEITESSFLEQVNWKESWGFPYRFYRPVFLAAKQGKSRVLAINAPKEIVRKVARSGLEGLTPREREGLPLDIRLDDKAHRAFVDEAFREHNHRDLKNYEYFYEAQCVWEETMAENIASYLREENPGGLLVLAGNGHIVHKFGIPDRTSRRIEVSIATVLPYPVIGSGPAEVLKQDTADYIWFTR